MKKLVCVLIIFCAAFLSVSCACVNDDDTQYTLNAVVVGVNDTDGGVTVELSPVVPYSPHSSTYIVPDVTPVYGYARYEGTDGYQSNEGWYMKSGNVLTYKLRRQEKAKELNGFADDSIIKFTVADGVIYRFENTGRVFEENETPYYWDDDLYNGEIIYD